MRALPRLQALRPAPRHRRTARRALADSLRPPGGLEADCVDLRFRAAQRLSELIEAQGETVGLSKGGWWGKKSTPGGKGGDRKSTNHARRSAHLISMAEAEAQTRIKHQQVSKWRLRLRQPDKYRGMLYGVTWARAMAEAVITTERAGQEARPWRGYAVVMRNARNAEWRVCVPTI